MICKTMYQHNNAVILLSIYRENELNVYITWRSLINNSYSIDFFIHLDVYMQSFTKKTQKMIGYRGSLLHHTPYYVEQQYELDVRNLFTLVHFNSMLLNLLEFTYTKQVLGTVYYLLGYISQKQVLSFNKQGNITHSYSWLDSICWLCRLSLMPGGGH